MSLRSDALGFATDVLLGLPTTSLPYDLTRDVAVPMPDGVVLVADHYRPRGIDGPLPVVLIRLPYGPASTLGGIFAATLARRGFQVLCQATRGTFGSGGQFRPFTTEHDDGLATLAWVREQPWCDGRVSMTGGSYFGHTQWAIAPYADPPLVSVSPHITASDAVGAVFYPGGAPQLRNGLSWSAEIGVQERHDAPELPGVRRRRLDAALRRLPLQAADVDVAGAPVGFWRDFTAHADQDDPFWEQADHHGADFSRMPPVNMVTGWWDLFAAGQLADYTALRAAGVPARIVVGPWMHGEPGELKEIFQSDTRWLAHHLYGRPAPDGPPVRVFLQNAGTWLNLGEWPPKSARQVVHHLRPGGGLTAEAEDVALPPSQFVYDPADPTPTVGGPLLSGPGKQADNGPVERRSDVLLFTGGVLDADLDLVGPVGARIHVRTELPHADVFVRLCDVDVRGVSRNIVDGIVRLRPDGPVAPDGDGVRAVDVELFPTAYRVAAGHRLRVQVSGGAFPRVARNMGTDEPFAAATEGRRNRFEVFHDAERPSSVTVSVLG